MSELEPPVALDARPTATWWQLGARAERVVVGGADWLMLCGAASPSARASQPVLAVAFVLIAMIALNGTRRPALAPAPIAEVPALFGRLGVAAVLVAPFAVAFGDLTLYATQVLASIVAVLVGRILVYAAIRGSRRRGWIARPTTLIGTGAATARAVELLAEHPEGGLIVTNRLPDVSGLDADAPIPTVVLLELDEQALAPAVAAVHQLQSAAGEVFVAPELASMGFESRRNRVEELAGLTLVRLAPTPTRRAGWRAKRAFDICVAALGLIVLSPVFVFAAVGTRLSSAGPILFRQPRVGRGGRIFTMYKFRTYPIDHVDDKFSREHDECPLPFGRFLRRSSIDELPQLLNVLKGDMSIVGPRPERPHFAGPLASVVAGYELRHRVPGGITGAAQVGGLWGNSCIDTRVRLDNEYIDDWTFAGDLRILASTAPAILRKGRIRAD